MKKILYFSKRAIYKIISKLELLHNKLFPKKNQDVVDEFHKLYYKLGVNDGTWRKNKFLGIPIQKCPMDMHIYQEILFDTKPDLIIETGTAYGGNALYLATICDALGTGEIVTVDTTKFSNTPKHKRVKYLLGSSIDKKVVDKIIQHCDNKKRIMVILDSDHTKNHVLAELNIYHKLVSKNCYLIVEDTNVNGHPVLPQHGPGPAEALNEFLLKNKGSFIIDKSKERSLITFNPGGYLKKVK